MNRFVGNGDKDSGAELPPTFQAFEAEAMACGSSEVLVREWAADAVTQTHTHPFDAEAVVIDGEMWLMEGNSSRHLTRGGTFRVQAGRPHSERYGNKGAILWVARRQQST